MPSKKQTTENMVMSGIKDATSFAFDTSKILLEESFGLLKGIVDDLAAPQGHPEAGSLNNAIDQLVGFVNEFIDWISDGDKKGKEAEKGGEGKEASFMDGLKDFLGGDAAKSMLSPDSISKFLKSDEVGNFLKSDAVKDLLSSEFVGNALKEFSGVISENSQLIKDVCPKELSDKILAFTVPANAASQGLKNPQNTNKSVNQLVDFSPDSIRANPQGYKALYDHSKSVINKAGDLSNVQKDPQLKNAMLSMAKVGPVLTQVDPSMTNTVAKDFRANMVKSPEFRKMAVDSAKGRLQQINGASYAKLDPNQKSKADFDVRTALLASALDRGLTDQKQIFDDVNKNFAAFSKDPEKGLKALTGNNVMNKANQRMQYSQQNPRQPHAVPIKASPVADLNTDTRKDMLKSNYFRAEQVQAAQGHLQEVLSKTGARTKEDIDKLPQGIRNEIIKDAGTILYGHMAHEAMSAKGINAMDNPEAIDKFANSKDINGLVNDTTKAFLDKPNADFTALLDNNKMSALGKDAVNKNTKMFEQGLEKQSKGGEFKMPFDDQQKEDMLKSRAMRAEKVGKSQDFIRNFADQHKLSTKADFEKLDPKDKQLLDNCIKTIGYGHAAEAAFKQSGKMGLTDPNARKELAGSKGLNDAANSTLENFYKNPGRNLGNILNNKKMQNLGNTLMKDQMGAFKSVATRESVKPKTFIANPNAGVKPVQRTNAMQQNGPAPYNSVLQNNMLRSPALRAESVNKAKQHLQSVMEKNGGMDNPDFSKLSDKAKEAVNNDLKTIAFGAALNNAVGEKGKVTNPQMMQKFKDSKAVTDFVNSSANNFMENPGPNSKIVLNDDMMKKTTELDFGSKKSEVNDVVQHSQAKNEEPLESFDNNLKMDMLKSKAFRDEKINEAQMHLKNTMEENGIQSASDFNKLSKTVQASMDRDVKTIVYGHVADQALSQNGMQEIKDPAVLSKFANSKTTDFLVKGTANNFMKDPVAGKNILLDNDAMKEQTSRTKADFTQELKKDTFDNELKENIIKNPTFRKKAIENASNSIKGMLDQDGKMSTEKYMSLSDGDKATLNANIQTIAYAQMANRALKSNGAASLSDPKAVDKLMNSECLNNFTNDVLKNVDKDPSSLSKVIDDKQMRWATKGQYEFGNNKQEMQGIMLNDDFELAKGIGTALQ